MEKTWKPTVAGIVDLVIACFTFMSSLMIFFIYMSCLCMWSEVGPKTLAGVTSLAMIVVSLFAMRGGIYALQRKKWRWALAGSVCVAPLVLFLFIVFTGEVPYWDVDDLNFPLIYLGVFASIALAALPVVLVALSKKEFKQRGDDMGEGDA